MLARLLPWLRLCRFPAVFTALADIIAGHYCAKVAIFRNGPRGVGSDLFLLLGASSGLYLAGMVFNDAFDVAQDTRERPFRPIPSGQITRLQALIFAVVLMDVGLTCAFAAGAATFQIALVLAACILAYDAILKRTWLGPIGMGACRSCNFILGASAGASTWAGAVEFPPIWLAGVMGLYITGLTWFARTEAKGSSLNHLVPALALMNFAILLTIGTPSAHFAVGGGRPYQNSFVAMICQLVILTFVNRHGILAIGDPSPARVQSVIGKFLIAVILIDAMFILTVNGLAGWQPAMAVLLLIVPMFLFRKLIAVT